MTLTDQTTDPARVPAASTRLLAPSPRAAARAEALRQARPDRAPVRRARRGARPRARRDPRTRSSPAAASATPRTSASVIKAQRRLELGSRAVLLFSLFPPAWLAGTAGLSVAKILENMEIGHNVMHGQWDWMRDPKIHSTTWEWDNASPAEQWKHSPQRAAPHLHQRARPRQRPRLRHHARRRGPALAPVLPRPAAVELHQRAASSSTASRPTTSSSARHLQGRKEHRRARVPARGQGGAAQDRPPGHQGLRRAPAAVRARRACTTLAANVTANLVRNLWTHSVIMCGHFPEGVETFAEDLDRGRDPRRVVPAPDARLGQHQRQPAMHLMTGNLSLPDRAPPVPRPAEQPLRARSRRRSRRSVERYGLTYTTGPLPKQVLSAWKQVVKLSLPNGTTPRGLVGQARARLQRRSRPSHDQWGIASAGGTTEPAGA